MKPQAAKTLITGFVSNLARLNSKEEKAVIVYTLFQKCVYYLFDSRTERLFSIVVSLAI